MSSSEIKGGPHQSIKLDGPQEVFLAKLFDRLWERYREQNRYVQVYEKLIADAGATFFNDHIAFRTLACQSPQTGIASLSRIFEALGYQAAGLYHFENKRLDAIHFQHKNAQLPKLFISQLRVWELDEQPRKAIEQIVATHRAPLSGDLLAALNHANAGQDNHDELVANVSDWICSLPWDLPQKSIVEAVNAHSQYGAWTLVHGYNVNHFTSLINSHQVEQLDSIEKTIDALRDAGVPMKSSIEGDAGSQLRQSSTEAVVVDVSAIEDGQSIQMPWTGTYFELAQRDPIVDQATGVARRFEGFLGAQATNLFDMTSKK